MEQLRAIQSLLDVVRRRYLVVGITVVIGLCLVAVLVQFAPRTYEATAQVLTVNGAQGRDASISSVDLPAVATSTEVLQRVRSRLALPLTLLAMKHSVRARVMVHSSLLTISYRDARPERAVAIANALADELVGYYGTLSAVRSQASMARLDAAISSARKRMDDLYDAQAAAGPDVARFADQKAADSDWSRLTDMRAQLLSAQARLAADTAALRGAADDARDTAPLSAQEVLDRDLAYQTVAKRLSADSSELASDQMRFTDAFPVVAMMRSKVADDERSLARARTDALRAAAGDSPNAALGTRDVHRAQAAIAGDQASVAGLTAAIANLRNGVARSPQQRRTAEWLAVERDAAQADYLALSNRRSAAVADAAEGLSLGSLVVADRAVAADAAVVGLGRSRLAVLAAFVVLTLAVGAALLADVLDPRLRSAQQIADLYRRRLIATLGSRP